MKRWLTGIVAAACLGIGGGSAEASHRAAERPDTDAVLANAGRLISPLAAREATDTLLVRRPPRGRSYYYYTTPYRYRRPGGVYYYPNRRSYYSDRYYRTYYGPNYYPPGYVPGYLRGRVQPGYRVGTGIWITF